MASIIVEISQAPGDTIIKRKVEIPSHTKDYMNSAYNRTLCYKAL